MINEDGVSPIFVELTRGNGDIIIWELVIPSDRVGCAYELIDVTVYPVEWNEDTGEQMAYNTMLSWDSYILTMDPSEQEELRDELLALVELNRKVLHDSKRTVC